MKLSEIIEERQLKVKDIAKLRNKTEANTRKWIERWKDRELCIEDEADLTDSAIYLIERNSELNKLLDSLLSLPESQYKKLLERFSSNLLSIK